LPIVLAPPADCGARARGLTAAQPRDFLSWLHGHAPQSGVHKHRFHCPWSSANLFGLVGAPAVELDPAVGDLDAEAVLAEPQLVAGVLALDHRAKFRRARSASCARPLRDSLSPDARRHHQADA
jgi:hypothetical protein